MRRHGRVGVAVAVAAILVIAGFVATGHHGAERATAAQSGPNIVVVMTDDQTVEDMVALPKVRSLIGDQGVTFANSLVAYSLCCPSRATFLTGQYPHNTHVEDNAPPKGGYASFKGQNTTMPVALQRAGYRTIEIGKYLNGYGASNPREIPPGWTDWNGGVDPTTYRMYNYTLNQNGTPVTHGAGNEPEQYQTDVFSRMAANKIQREATMPGPFFLYVAPLAPHAESARQGGVGRDTVRAAPRDEGHYSNAPMPRTPAFNEADVSDKPGFIRSRAQLGPVAIQGAETRYRDRLEALMAVDDLVENVVNTLTQTGQLGDTAIFFTSDNGFFHGEHRWPQGKILIYEPSVRVPLLARLPGAPAGRIETQPVANIDLAPTILDLAGATPLRTMDGVSLAPLLRDPAARLPSRDLEIESQHSTSQMPAFQAIRSGRYEYVQYETGERELYDLVKDPFQLTSRHKDPALASVRQSLALRLKTLSSCIGSGCLGKPDLVVRLRWRKGRTHSGRSCVRSRLRFAVGGADVGLVARVDVRARGKRIATDTAAPFRHSISLRKLRRGRLTTVETRVLLSNGGEVRYKRRVRRC